MELSRSENWGALKVLKVQGKINTNRYLKLGGHGLLSDLVIAIETNFNHMECCCLSCFPITLTWMMVQTVKREKSYIALSSLTFAAIWQDIPELIIELKRREKQWT